MPCPHKIAGAFSSIRVAVKDRGSVEQSREARNVSPLLPSIAKRVVPISILVSLAVLTLVGVTLWQANKDAWEEARRNSQNVVQSIVGYVERHVEGYRLALQVVGTAANDAEFWRVPPESRHQFLSLLAEGVAHIGSIVILDAEGNIEVDSQSNPPRSANFADRDYFLVHRDNANAGVFLSAPYVGSLEHGEPTVVLSARVSKTDGSFGGIVRVSVPLNFFTGFFSRIDQGDDGVVVLIDPRRTVLVQHPAWHDRSGIERAIMAGFGGVSEQGSEAGSFIGELQSDGVERLYTFGRVQGQPLIAVVGASTASFLATWRTRMLVIGGLALGVCAGILLLAFALRREFTRRARAEADLAFLALTDPLTGLANRRRFDEVIHREWRRTGRTSSSIALLMIDADKFKQLNDRYGHTRGDEVLRSLARVIESCTQRPADMSARYGGEEFAVLLPDTDEAGAWAIAEQIRGGAAVQVGTPDAELPSFTVSIGVACTRPTPEGAVEAFIEAADAALYRAKQAGRNCVVLAS